MASISEPNRFDQRLNQLFANCLVTFHCHREDLFEHRVLNKAWIAGAADGFNWI